MVENGGLKQDKIGTMGNIDGTINGSYVILSRNIWETDDV